MQSLHANNRLLPLHTSLRDVVNNYENEVRDHRLTIQDLERTHRGTLMKTNGEKQDYREAKEASKRFVY